MASRTRRNTACCSASVPETRKGSSNGQRKLATANGKKARALPFFLPTNDDRVLNARLSEKVVHTLGMQCRHVNTFLDEHLPRQRVHYCWFQTSAGNLETVTGQIPKQ